MKLTATQLNKVLDDPEIQSLMSLHKNNVRVIGFMDYVPDLVFQDSAEIAKRHIDDPVVKARIDESTRAYAKIAWADTPDWEVYYKNCVLKQNDPHLVCISDFSAVTRQQLLEGRLRLECLMIDYRSVMTARKNLFKSFPLITANVIAWSSENKKFMLQKRAESSAIYPGHYSIWGGGFQPSMSFEGNPPVEKQADKDIFMCIEREFHEETDKRSIGMRSVVNRDMPVILMQELIDNNGNPSGAIQFNALGWDIGVDNMDRFSCAEELPGNANHEGPFRIFDVDSWRRGVGRAANMTPFAELSVAIWLKVMELQQGNQPQVSVANIEELTLASSVEVVFNPVTRDVSVDGKLVGMQPKEFWISFTFAKMLNKQQRFWKYHSSDIQDTFKLDACWEPQRDALVFSLLSRKLMAMQGYSQETYNKVMLISKIVERIMEGSDNPIECQQEIKSALFGMEWDAVKPRGNKAYQFLRPLNEALLYTSELPGYEGKSADFIEMPDNAIFVFEDDEFEDEDLEEVYREADEAIAKLKALCK